MRKIVVLLLVALNTIGLVGCADKPHPLDKPVYIMNDHQYQYTIDRIEDGKWVVVEIYDVCCDTTYMADIEIQ